MTAEPFPATSGPEKSPLAKPKPAKRAGKKPSGKKPSKKPVSKDLNKSEEIRKVATKMKAGGQKVRPSLIVQELAKQNVVVAPAQVSMVLKRMGFKPLRKRMKRVGGESNANVPAKASKASSLGIEDLLAAKKAVEAFGGSDRAIEAIRAVKRLEG
jgi:transposase